MMRTLSIAGGVAVLAVIVALAVLAYVQTTRAARWRAEALRYQDRVRRYATALREAGQAIADQNARVAALQRQGELLRAAMERAAERSGAEERAYRDETERLHADLERLRAELEDLSRCDACDRAWHWATAVDEEDE